MPTPIDPNRLPALKTALARYGEGDTVSQQQAAEIYGVAPARMSTLIKARFPDFPAPLPKDGSKTNFYPARAAIQSMIDYLEGTGKQREEQAKRHTELLTGVRAEQPQAPAEPVRQMTAAEMDKLVSARARMFKLQREMGMFVAVDEVRGIMRGVNLLIASEISGLPRTIDPNGQLPAVERERLQKKANELVFKLREAMGSYLEEEDDVRSPPGAFEPGSGSGRNLRRSDLPKRGSAMV